MHYVRTDALPASNHVSENDPTRSENIHLFRDEPGVVLEDSVSGRVRARSQRRELPARERDAECGARYLVGLACSEVLDPGNLPMSRTRSKGTKEHRGHDQWQREATPPMATQSCIGLLMGLIIGFVERLPTPHVGLSAHPLTCRHAKKSHRHFCLQPLFVVLERPWRTSTKKGICNPRAAMGP
jgi:hypothetical protein